MNWQSTLPPFVTSDDVSTSDLFDYSKAWRNRELAATDWTQLPDCPLTSKDEWAVYRQELRDLPAQGADPKLWVFPVPPT